MTDLKSRLRAVTFDVEMDGHLLSAIQAAADEIERLEHDLAKAREDALEEAAVVANNFDFGLDSQSGLVADIRALKGNP